MRPFNFALLGLFSCLYFLTNLWERSCMGLINIHWMNIALLFSCQSHFDMFWRLSNLCHYLLDISRHPWLWSHCQWMLHLSSRQRTMQAPRLVLSIPKNRPTQHSWLLKLLSYWIVCLGRYCFKSSSSPQITALLTLCQLARLPSCFL